MAQKNAIPNKLKEWIDARKRYNLSDRHVQMARELGLNPKKFGGLANHKQEQWKLPLPQFIEHLYSKSFGRNGPVAVSSHLDFELHSSQCLFFCFLFC